MAKKATKVARAPSVSSSGATSSRSASPEAGISSHKNARNEDGASSSGASDSSGESDSDEPVDEEVRAMKDRKLMAKKAQEEEKSKYEPPSGYKPVKNLGDGSALDWNSFNSNPNLELWAIRIPAGLKTKYLEGMKIHLPPSFTPENSTASLATVTVKKSEYDLYLSSASPSATKAGKRKADTRDVDDDEQQTYGVQGGEEMQSFVPLLPRKSQNDQLLRAPRPITHNLVLTRSLPTTVLSHLPSSRSSLIASQPSPVPGAILSAEEVRRAKDADVEAKLAERVVRDQPSGLKYRLELPGTSGVVGGKGDFQNPGMVVVRPPAFMEVDEQETQATQEAKDETESPKKEKSKKEKSPKKKKRDAEADDADAEEGQEKKRKKKTKVKHEIEAE